MPRHVGWIYLPILPSGDDLDASMEEMIQLRNRLSEGESFEDLAREYSDDISASNGGYLGTFGPGEMTFAFEDAAFSLEPGEISEPVLTTFGIHIIKLNARNEDGTVEASHILRLVPIEEDDLDRTVVLGDSIAIEINASRLTFEDAARIYSSDISSSDEGGDMGIIPLKIWIPKIASAAAELETGACSDPVVLEDMGAVILFRIVDEAMEIEWNSYSDAELTRLVQQVVYEDTYSSVIDSLRGEIPVIYFLENDDPIEN